MPGERTKSITYTVAIIVSLLLAVFGAVIAGIGGTGDDPTAISITIGDYVTVAIATLQVGLIILVVGAVLTAVLLIFIPEGYGVYGPGTQTFLETLAEYQTIALIFSLLVLVAGTILLVLTFIF